MLQSQETSFKTRLQFSAESLGIIAGMSIHIDAGLLMYGMFLNDFIEANGANDFVNLIRDSHLGGIESMIELTNLPEVVAKDVRIWGLKKVLGGAFATASRIALDTHRERALKGIIEVAVDYASTHLEQELNRENFWQEILGWSDISLRHDFPIKSAHE